MTTVYLCTGHSYEGGEVMAIFFNKGKAEAYCEEYNKTSMGQYDRLTVQESEVIE